MWMFDIQLNFSTGESSGSWRVSIIKIQIFKYLYLHSSVEKYGLNKWIKMVSVIGVFFFGSSLKPFSFTILVVCNVLN